MKLAVVGSRSFNDFNLLCSKLRQISISEIISGGARGADSLGAKFAKENNIKLTVFPADWDMYGKSAGYIRNKRIIENCDQVIAFWDGNSKGTKHSIDLAKQMNKPTTIVKFYNEFS